MTAALGHYSPAVSELSSILGHQASKVLHLAWKLRHRTIKLSHQAIKQASRDADPIRHAYMVIEREGLRKYASWKQKDNLPIQQVEE